MGTASATGDECQVPKEIKLAVAMNGGVSLAVWIGGVAYELARASECRSESGCTSPWKAALGGREVTVDVMAGTSAGGINAAFLALHRAYGACLTPLRAMWLNTAGLEPPPNSSLEEPHLLRPPRKGVPSLLDGDLFFDRLVTAFNMLLDSVARDSEPVPEPCPVDLRLTTTSFEGREEPLPDDLKSDLHERSHRASFHFVEEDHPQGACSLRFSHDDKPLLAAQLARAARSTASFPFAFEPSRARSEAETAGLVGAGASDHLLDGGVLNNLPLDHAIEAIFAMHANERPERWLVAVVPDPSGPDEPPVAEPVPPVAEPVPSVGDIVMASLVGIPRNQTVRAFVEEVRAHNATVAGRSDARRKLLELDPSRLGQTAQALYPSYQESRRTALAVELSGRVGAPNYREVLKRFPAALPQLPPTWPAGRACWEASVLLRHVALLLKLHTDARAPARFRHEIHQIRKDAGALSHPCTDETGSEWPARVERELRGWPLGPGSASEEVNAARERLKEGLCKAASVLVDLVKHWRGGSPPAALQNLAVDPQREAVDPQGEALRILNALEVLQGAFSTFEHDPDQEVKLGFLTPRIVAPLDRQNRHTAARKLAGEELGHFGAFLKRSWRANDWMWGRLDAASFLFDILGQSANVPQEAKCEIQRDIVRDEARFVIGGVAADREAGAASPKGEELVGTGDGRKLTEKSSWCEIASALNLGPDPEAAFLEKCCIGDEDVDDEMSSSLTARLGIRAAATSLTVLRGARIPVVQPAVSNVLAPVRVIMVVADRYAAALRPRRAEDRDAAWLARLATMAVAALGAANLVGIDMGSAAPFVWLTLAGLLLTLTWVAPVTTLLTALLVCGVGFATALPDELRPGGWDERLVPLNRAIAIAVITLLLTGISSRRVDRFDRFLRRILRRGDQTLRALDDATSADRPNDALDDAKP